MKTCDAFIPDVVEVSVEFECIFARSLVLMVVSSLRFFVGEGIL